VSLGCGFELVLLLSGSGWKWRGCPCYHWCWKSFWADIACFWSS